LRQQDFAGLSGALRVSVAPGCVEVTRGQIRATLTLSSREARIAGMGVSLEIAAASQSVGAESGENSVLRGAVSLRLDIFAVLVSDQPVYGPKREDRRSETDDGQGLRFAGVQDDELAGQR